MAPAPTLNARNYHYTFFAVIVDIFSHTYVIIIILIIVWYVEIHIMKNATIMMLNHHNGIMSTTTTTRSNDAYNLIYLYFFMHQNQDRIKQNSFWVIIFISKLHNSICKDSLRILTDIFFHILINSNFVWIREKFKQSQWKCVRVNSEERYTQNCKLR